MISFITHPLDWIGFLYFHFPYPLLPSASQFSCGDGSEVCSGKREPRTRRLRFYRLGSLLLGLACQLGLVGVDVSFPVGDGVLLTYPDLLRHLHNNSISLNLLTHPDLRHQHNITFISTCSPRFSSAAQHSLSLNLLTHPDLCHLQNTAFLSTCSPRFPSPAQHSLSLNLLTHPDLCHLQNTAFLSTCSHPDLCHLFNNKAFLSTCSHPDLCHLHNTAFLSTCIHTHGGCFLCLWESCCFNTHTWWFSMGVRIMVVLYVCEDHTFTHMKVVFYACEAHAFKHTLTWEAETDLKWESQGTNCSLIHSLPLPSPLQPTIIPLTWEISLKSWDTRIMPPSKSLMASARASMVSMSRWLVGSSRRSRWGHCQDSQAKVTRQRWPSDRLRIGQIWGTANHNNDNAIYSAPRDPHWPWTLRVPGTPK